jgi:hypothetical protein
VGELIETFGVNYHHFADDTRIYVSLSATNAASTVNQLSACTAAVRRWFLLNGLQLNASKSEAMMLGIRYRCTASIRWSCRPDS